MIFAYQQDHHKFPAAWADDGYTVRLQGASATCRTVCLGGPAVTKFYVKTVFRKSDSAPLLLSPCARRRTIFSNVDVCMVKNTMTPTIKTDVTFEHIGAARLYNGSVRIDVKTMQAVI